MYCGVFYCDITLITKMYYTNQERYEILEVYLKCEKNACRARREYFQQYPNRAPPSIQTFRRIELKLRETSSLQNKKRTEGNVEARDMDILLYFQENSNASIVEGTRHLGFSFGLIQKVLKRNKFFPYKIRPVQELSIVQIENRLNYTSYMTNRLREEPNFFNKILWTDEATFTTAGYFNRHNTRHWSLGNPQKMQPIPFQGRRSVHVWCGILDNKILGPIFFEQTLNSNSYNALLTNEIENFLDDIPLRQRNQIVWQQDGAPPHCGVVTKNYLNETYNEWIGRGGSIAWPANSPDLTPLDTFLWGYLKNKCYQSRRQNIDEIKIKIGELIENLNGKDNVMLENTIENMKKRYIACVENGGRHIEQLL